MKTLRKGFTLVELLVALAVGGILSVLVYGLFDSTSDALLEVENLSDANERLRFAMERVRSDIQGAGSHATPDSNTDVWAVPPAAHASSYRVLGVSGFAGWQDSRTPLGATGANTIADQNPDVSFDSFIVMGAYEYPISFELSELQAASTAAVIPGNLRGLNRLWSVNPFPKACTANADCGTTRCINNACELDTTVGAFGVPATTFGALALNRLLRITDRQGKVQFVGVEGLATSGTTDLSLTLSKAPIFKEGGREDGLDPNPDGDVSYEAAFVDAFWYRVTADPLDPTNLRLVRTRLCAKELVSVLTAPASLDAAKLLSIASGCGELDEVVIADRVADFQVWFDCGNTTTGAIENITNTFTWDAPDNTGTCMAVSNDPTYSPGRVRRAHIRMSMYAPNERKDLAHYRFEDAAGNVCPDAPAACANVDPNTQLRTFDIIPDLVGAAPVVTLQSSVELPNFSYRNVRF